MNRRQEKESNWKPSLNILYSSIFKSVHIWGEDFLKHVLHDKNLSVSKYLHVKTATKYGECVKILMKGGDILIEPCGCILCLKSTSMCFALTSAQNTQIYNPPQLCHLAQNTSHPLKEINIIVGKHINEMQSNGQG